MSNWTTVDIPLQSGRLAVVTGSTGGLGFETAKALAAAGADVIIAARNAEKGQAALSEIAATVPEASVRFELLDLASLQSVADFARRLIWEGRPIDLLVNNAAVMQLPKRQTTADGFEMQFGTNYLGHFALTAQLLPLLQKAVAPRVTHVSSLAHRQGKIDFADLQGERRYGPFKAYCQSKLANLIFAIEMQRRSDREGWNILSNAAHPGFARTNLMANGPGEKGLMKVVSVMLSPLFQSAAAGALPILYAATAPDAKGGGYYGPNGFYETKGAVAPAVIKSPAQDEVVAGKLWDRSEQLTGVHWPVAESAATTPAVSGMV